MNPRPSTTPTALALAALLTISGCDNREAEIAREAADRQAEQNRTMAQLQQEVAVGTRRLAENDARARQQALEVHHDLQGERSQMTDGWDSLEAERQTIARQRRTDSFLAALVTGGGAAVAALFALAFAWLALLGQRRQDDAAESFCELLAEDLLAENLLLSSATTPNAALLGAGIVKALPCTKDDHPNNPEEP